MTEAMVKKELQAQLETPCVVVDIRKAEENVIKWQKAVDAAGCKMRPHIKTHKMPYFAKMQLQHGASGITCAKVGEAEVMASSGIDDIFIAYPMVGAFRVKRVIALAKKVNRLILAVDSMEIATPLNEAAKQAGLVLEVRMEVDTGAKRTGVVRENAVSLAKQISQLSHIKLTGIYTFKSLILHNEVTVDNEKAAQEEGELMQSIAEEIRNAGVPIEEISAGSTPTGIQVAQTGKITETRPGTYIFGDHMLCMEKAAQPSDIAVRIYATVVSTPCKEYAVIDGGTKTFPMDITPNVPPYYYPGYALLAGSDDLQLLRMNEEHGIITSKKGDTELKVGDILELVPIHVCTAVNMQNEMYLYDGETLKKEKIAARGMLV